VVRAPEAVFREPGDPGWPVTAVRPGDPVPAAGVSRVARAGPAVRFPVGVRQAPRVQAAQVEHRAAEQGPVEGAREFAVKRVRGRQFDSVPGR
jgi:hypothetical protein